MIKIEHIGIAVKNIESANKLFAALLGAEPYKTENVESEKVSTSFFRAGESKIELLEASDPGSAIARFISKRGEGIHHIAFDVADIRSSMKQLKDAGFELLSDEPKRGADNKLVCFLHPKSTNGVLVELCEEIKAV
jgi:methylmalonyl-CoA/ethylmalonyl-CoA epimerase